jgi:hypothetical protein
MKIQVIANALGVEMGEEFYLVGGGVKQHRCRFTDKGIERLTGGEWTVMNGLLEKVLFGGYTAEPVDWKPKIGEAYFTYFQENWVIRRVVNKGTFESLLKIRSGVAFRTRDEALAAREAVYEMITGKKWGER